MTLAAVPQPASGRPRRPTATARFGSSRRESHDATGFYRRFVAPELSNDTTISPPSEVDVIYRADARDMTQVPASSVALVVTSPPYFAGKQYEESLGENGVPATYFEYLALLRAVFDECKRVLEPGGRIAVNVANLGRRPYRSLAGDVAEILQDLGLLLRGEVVWWKGRAAGGSCAWGTFQRPANPVLRDVTERVVIASKGRFDRALSPAEREAAGHPSEATISREEFLEATTDLWEMPPERATRVGHPAPFPVQLPLRLIELYTYRHDVVLDPFMGAGSTAVAALRSGRHYVGFDTDESYCATAEARIASERSRPPATAGERDDERIARAVRDGLMAKEIAGMVLHECGFVDIRPDVKVKGLAMELTFVGRDRYGDDWAFDVCGAFTTTRAGLRRTDTLWKAIGKAAVLHEKGGLPFVLLTTDTPVPGSAGDRALNAVRGPGRPVFDVVELLNPHDRARLRDLARNGRAQPA